MNNFEKHINGDTPVLVDFFAQWCGHCKMMPPILNRVKVVVGGQAIILKMDVEKNRFYLEKYGIQATPTFIIFKNGKVMWRKSGVTSVQEIMQHLALHVL